MRIGLIAAIVCIEGGDIFFEPIVQGRFGPAFVIATPDSDTRMITDSFDFFDEIETMDIFR